MSSEPAGHHSKLEDSSPSTDPDTDQFATASSSLNSKITSPNEPESFQSHQRRRSSKLSIQSMASTDPSLSNNITGHPNEGEFDALGLLHNDISSDSSTGAGSGSGTDNLNDHRRYSHPVVGVNYSKGQSKSVHYKSQNSPTNYRQQPHSDKNTPILPPASANAQSFRKPKSKLNNVTMNTSASTSSTSLLGDSSQSAVTSNPQPAYYFKKNKPINSSSEQTPKTYGSTEDVGPTDATPLSANKSKFNSKKGRRQLNSRFKPPGFQQIRHSNSRSPPLPSSSHIKYNSENPFEADFDSNISIPPSARRDSKLIQQARRQTANRRFSSSQGNSAPHHQIFNRPRTSTSMPDGDSSSLSLDEDEDDSMYASSNPSSRRSSNVSSLDDVCFPIESLDEGGKKKLWPDISVLEEFALEEAEESRKINEASAALSRASSFAASTIDGDDNVGFQYPLVSNVDNGGSFSETEAFLVSTEDETDLFEGRLRPQIRPTPWNNNKRSNTPEAFLNFQDRQSKQEKFRFTYFREDLENTIHSTNISGLVADNGLTFADLFLASHYANHSPTTVENDMLVVPQSNVQLSKEPSPVNQQQSQGQAAAQSQAQQLPFNGLNSGAPLQSSQTSLKSKIAANTVTPTPSIKTESITATLTQPQQPVAPFWVDVLNPTEEEMKVISKAFGIHPLTTEDIFLGETREKVELFKDYYLVCFTSFDVVQQHHNRKKAMEKAAMMLQQADLDSANGNNNHNNKDWFRKILDLFPQITTTKQKDTNGDSSSLSSKKRDMNASLASKRTRARLNKKSKNGDLEPLNMYIIVFRDGVITFHFKPTPHSGNVRRRARLLRDYLTVSSDWIGYALIDDITDAYAPLIESIEDEVNAIEDAILIMQSGVNSDDESSDDESSEDEVDKGKDDRIWFKLRKRRNSTVHGAAYDKLSLSSRSSRSSASSSNSAQTKILSWKRKGDMLRRIGDCRKRVMSLLRLLGFKADVIKGFSKRCNEQWDVAPRSEIGMYLGDIQDHIVTMVQSLNHYEKLLARSHSNYLAQINIDMTKVNNDMNDILGKITILGTIVLPLNIVTGLWGMNCIVPGQDHEGLTWFWGIVVGMSLFAVCCYYYAKKISGIM